ncbi:MAG: hypothetical protein WA667_17315 [Candidatus Nitrosopolaris sp.]
MINGIEIDIEDSKLTFRFKFSNERPSSWADNIFNLFKDVCKIYDNHPIFASEEARQQIIKTGLKIPEICQYFSKLKKNFISIDDYMLQMEGRYKDKLTVVKKFAEKSSTDKEEVILIVREIEKNELLKLTA